jgi:hypothetical protein
LLDILTQMTSRSEKGAASFQGIKLLLCENPLPPIDEAIAAAQAEAHRKPLGSKRVCAGSSVRSRSCAELPRSPRVNRDVLSALGHAAAAGRGARAPV